VCVCEREREREREEEEEEEMISSCKSPSLLGSFVFKTYNISSSLQSRCVFT